MCVKTWTKAGKAATHCAVPMSVVPVLRLDKYSEAATLRDVAVVVADSLDCGNCL
jgi:hypothetical protein